MKNADMPAMPIPGGKTIQSGALNIEVGNGLTKRETFAYKLMVGFLSNSNVESLSFHEYADAAVNLADALLERLEK